MGKYRKVGLMGCPLVCSFQKNPLPSVWLGGLYNGPLWLLKALENEALFSLQLISYLEHHLLLDHHDAKWSRYNMCAGMDCGRE